MGLFNFGKNKKEEQEVKNVAQNDKEQKISLGEKLRRMFGGKTLSDEDLDTLVFSDDFLDTDRKSMGWASDENELRELWKKRTINELIVQIISDELSEKEQHKSKKGKSTPEIPPKERVLKRIDNLLRDKMNAEPIDILEDFLNALARVYDPHTAYMAPATSEEFNMDMSLRLTGIGVSIAMDNGYPKIIRILPGSPAEKDGRLQVGDYLIGIENEKGEVTDLIDTKLEKIVMKIRGPEGSPVTLHLIKGENGRDSLPEKITIIRREVLIKDSEAKGTIRIVKDSKGFSRRIGVIRLPSFYMDFETMHKNENYKCASADVRKILENFKSRNVDGVILDIRGNAGGSLVDCVDLAGLFIPEGPVVQVLENKKCETYSDKDGYDVVYDGPLLVMVNRLSASASEIFAAMIQDYGRGIIVGDKKTYGKGTVQALLPLETFLEFLLGRKAAAGALRLTIGKFYRVNGYSTQLRGVTPDIIFPSCFDYLEYGEEYCSYPLECDSVSPLTFQKSDYDEELHRLLPALRVNSEERIRVNPGFQKLERSIAYFKERQENKKLSLNLKKRREGYFREKKASDLQKALIIPEKTEKNEKDDCYLDECVNILCDWIESSEK